MEKLFSLVHRVCSFATFSNPLQYYRQSCKNFKHFLQRCQYDCEESENFVNEHTLSNKEKVKFNSTELYRSVLSYAFMVESYQRGIKN